MKLIKATIKGKMLSIQRLLICNVSTIMVAISVKITNQILVTALAWHLPSFPFFSQVVFGDRKIQFSFFIEQSYKAKNLEPKNHLKIIVFN